MTVIGITTFAAAIDVRCSEAFRRRVETALDMAQPRIKHSEAARLMGVTEKHFSDFLRGLRPLSGDRFEALPQHYHDAYDALKAAERGALLVLEPHLLRLLEGVDRLVMAKCEPTEAQFRAMDPIVNPVKRQVS